MSSDNLLIGVGMQDQYTTDYELGQDNLKKFGMDIHHPVFWISAILVLFFVIATLIAPGDAKGMFDGAKSWSINNFDWLFMVGGNVFVLFCFVLLWSLCPLAVFASAAKLLRRNFPPYPGSPCFLLLAWASA